MIKFLDLKSINLQFAEVFKQSLIETLQSGFFIGGPDVETFERAFSDYVEADYCVSVGNGYDALKLSLICANLDAYDEVIVPANTFIATWLAVKELGLKIVPVDVDKSTGGMCIKSLQRACTQNTKVIIPVHLYGLPVNLEEINKIADEVDALIIEDAAQAHGAKIGDKKIGGHSDYVCWSFYPGKNLGALGDGGAITTNNKEIYEKLRILRNYGSKSKYEHILPGINSRLDPLQARFLSCKLKSLEIDIRRRREIADIYNSAFATLPITYPLELDRVRHAYHLYVIFVSERDRLQRFLADKGVETLIHYPIACHKQPVFSEFSDMNFPNTEEICNTSLSLPIGTHLDNAQIKFIVKCIHEFYVD